MCNRCQDPAHEDVAAEAVDAPGRRRLLLGGAGALAAAPVLMAAQAGAQAAGAAADPGTGPWSVRAWAADSRAAKFAPITIQRRALGPKDVLLDILYAGICHSDLHHVYSDWGETKYPIVPGHEILGRVIAVGAEVTKFKVGDLGGVGCMVDSCGTCANCLADREQNCLDGTTFTYASQDKVSGGLTQGGYSDRVTVTERFVIRIPPGMDPVSTAPILCAGITTFSPMRHWELKPGQKLGVVGLGGLGHMALKLGVAHGADVTVFTTTPAKLADAKRMGARDAVLWSDAEGLKRVAGTLDLAIATVPESFDMTPFVDALRLDATLVNVGALGVLEPKVRGSQMAFGRKSIAGSVIGGIAETQQVVDWCATRNIRPEVEVIKPEQISAAYERVMAKDVRYRFVIDFASSKA